MNSFETRLVVQIFCFNTSPASIFMVPRGPWIGLPACLYLGDRESVESAARRALDRFALIRSLGKGSPIAVEPDCSWDGKPASFFVFDFPRADIVPATGEAAWDDPSFRDPRFDVTVECIRRHIGAA